RTRQSGKVAHGYHPHQPARRTRTQLPLCAALERTRHRAQDVGAARDRYLTDDRDRSDRRHGPTDHHARPRLRRVDRLRLAGLSRSPNPPTPTAWVPRFPTLAATPCSRWLASPARTILMHLISVMDHPHCCRPRLTARSSRKERLAMDMAVVAGRANPSSSM